MLYKVDLHTHSVASQDGGLHAKHYRKLLDRKKLDCVAITDHNTIDSAQTIQKELGADRIIVGEEISTTQGDVIGLYLQQAIPAGLSLAETMTEIHKQGGLVYIPHPFETVRKGVAIEMLQLVATEVDIIEVLNGRAVFQNRSGQAFLWSMAHSVPGAASSDAHGPGGFGHTYTLLNHMPTRNNLVQQLAEADYMRSFPGVRGLMYPKFNRFKHWGQHA